MGVWVCGCVGVQVRFRVSLLESQWQCKVQQERSMAFLMLTHQRLGLASIWSVLEPGTQFACFTSTKVQILTPDALPGILRMVLEFSR